MTIVRMALAALVPAALTLIFALLEKNTRFREWKAWKKQLLWGAAFGLFAILSTVCGVRVQDGAIMNVRDAAPLCAGLLFGSGAGLTAGVIGGLYRWLCNGPAYTRLACSLATVLAGIFSSLMRRYLFERRNPSCVSAFGIGSTMEVLHMLLVLATNLSDVSNAFYFVKVCTIPMALCSGFAVSLSTAVRSALQEHEKLPIKIRHLSYDFSFSILNCVIIAFLATSTFTQQVIYQITSGKTAAQGDITLYRDVTLYLVVFMEILIYTALFILIYELLKRKILKNLQRVNHSLTEITNGNLDTTVNVRSHVEFSELSDHVNETVDTLKRYIREAEERIDKELELAREIQRSALPSVFPPFPARTDFDLYASMDPAKEVGGDFYDFYLIGKHTLIILIADVSGKGIPAALFMMRAKTLLKGLTESGRPVDEAFTIANEKLCESNEAGMFLTAWIGSVNLHTGVLTYANAGHNPPLMLARNGKAEYLRTRPNFILAGMEGTQYKAHTCQLHPGDTLYLYTDGVTESMDRKGRLYGEKNLCTALDLHGRQSPKEICQGIRQNVEDFAEEAAQSDDMTMLCFRLNTLETKDSIRFCPERPSMPGVLEFFRSLIESENLPPKLSHRMEVSLDEILANLVSYSTASQAEISLHGEDTLFTLTFRDNGLPFDPTRAKDPDVAARPAERPIGGLGIFIVKKMASSMRYTRANGQNILTLTFDPEEAQTEDAKNPI